MPSGEVYESMQRGVVNAAEAAGAAINWQKGWNEIADYLYLGSSRAPSNTGSLIIREDNWAKLDDDLKLLFTDVCSEYQRIYLSDTLAQEGEYLQMFIDYGVEVGPIPQEIDDFLIKTAKDFYEESAATDPFYAEIYQALNEWKEMLDLQGIH